MSWDGSDGKVCQAGYGQRVPSQGGRGRDGWVGRVGMNGKMRCWAGLPAQGAGRARNGGDESVSRRCGPPRGQASSRGKRDGAGQGAAQPPAVHCRVRGPPPKKGARADKSGGSNGAEPAGARCHLSRPAGRLSLSRARQHSCLARRHPAGRTHTQGQLVVGAQLAASWAASGRGTRRATELGDDAAAGAGCNKWCRRTASTAQGDRSTRASNTGTASGGGLLRMFVTARRAACARGAPRPAAHSKFAKACPHAPAPAAS